MNTESKYIRNLMRKEPEDRTYAERIEILTYFSKKGVLGLSSPVADKRLELLTANSS